MKYIKEIIGNLRVAMTDARQNESHFESWMILNEAICDAIDALAEQPIQRKDAVGMIEGQMYEDGTRAHNIVHWATRNAENDFPVGTLLYTHPALPLTHEQRLDVMKEFENHRMKWDDIAILIDLVEAKHGIGEQR